MKVHRYVGVGFTVGVSKLIIQFGQFGVAVVTRLACLSMQLGVSENRGP